MAGKGSIDFELTEAATAELLAAISAISSKLPQGVALSAKKKASLAKMGPKSVDFVERSLAHAQQNPGLVPASVVDLEAWARDFRLARNGQSVVLALRATLEQTEAATTLSGAEAMEAALLYYGVLRAAADKVTGLKGAADDLGKRFKRAKSEDSDPEPPTT
jgi:hypothetical protein